MVKQALILASGLGKRMQPLTNYMPKPMVEIRGQSLIARAIDKLHQAGITKIIVTGFYKAQMLKEHVLQYTRLHYPDLQVDIVIEDELHEVWGSIKKALPSLDSEPFLLVNGDAYWVDSGNDVIEVMCQKWDASKMKALMLLYPRERAIGYEGRGDFDLDNERVIDPSISTSWPYVYIGLQIINPAFLRDYPLKRDSIFSIYAIEGYLGIYGTIYDGYWFHIGTPASIIETEKFLDRLGLRST